jgi:hypothetical protein
VLCSTGMWGCLCLRCCALQECGVACVCGVVLYRNVGLLMSAVLCSTGMWVTVYTLKSHCQRYENLCIINVVSYHPVAVGIIIYFQLFTFHHAAMSRFEIESL